MRPQSVGVLAFAFPVIFLSSLPVFAWDDSCSELYDVLHYDITLTVDIENETLSGDTRILILSQASGLDSIALDFTRLNVDSVTAGGDTLAHLYEDPHLTIYLAEPAGAGDTLEVDVAYHGHPGNEGPDGSGGFFFEGIPKRAFQIGLDLEANQPSMGRYWFPCRDWPCDKATAEYHITMSGMNKTVVCNGHLTGVVADSTANLITYHWEEFHPVSTHLMTLHAGKYADLVDSTYPWIEHFVYPNQVDDAAIHLENVALMMDALVYRYGPYPFDRFGYVAVPQHSMHHQACVTVNAGTITPDTRNEWLLANLLGNQWWGCCVSVGDWRDIWLSRSFGMYSEAIFKEYANGPEAYHDYIYEDNMCHVIRDLGYSSLYDPLFPHERTVFEKGSCVLHMLRYVLGESTFFDAVRAYRQAYEYGTATTQDFQQVMETVSGEDLDWFFTEWVYDIRWPVYEYSWHERGGPDAPVLDIVVDQVQEAGPVFTMPMEVLVETVSEDTLLNLWLDEAHEEFSVGLADHPTGVTLDPDHWILMEAEEVPFAGMSSDPGAAHGLMLTAYPSPSGETFTIRFAVSCPLRARVEIFDPLGRSVRRLVDRLVGRGVHETAWPGTDRAGNRVAPGVYLCRVSAGGEQVTSRLLIVR
jgi:aminopeptidase N